MHVSTNQKRLPIILSNPSLNYTHKHTSYLLYTGPWSDM